MRCETSGVGRETERLAVQRDTHNRVLSRLSVEFIILCGENNWRENAEKEGEERRAPKGKYIYIYICMYIL